MEITSHRGCGYEPENTLLGFETALKLSPDFIECDVHTSKDGHLMVIHDYRLERTTNGKGLVCAYTKDELQKLDAGKGEKIPSLEEVYGLCKNVRLAVEVKAFGIEQLVVDFIQKHNAYGKIHVCSFNQQALKKIREIDAGISTGLIFYGVSNDLGSLLKELDVEAYHPSPEFLLPEHVNIAHKQKCLVHVFTPPLIDDVKRFCSYDVDGLVTDYPDIIRKMLQ